jgi:hypothetical protein
VGSTPTARTTIRLNENVADPAAPEDLGFSRVPAPFLLQAAKPVNLHAANHFSTHFTFALVLADWLQRKLSASKSPRKGLS